MKAERLVVLGHGHFGRALSELADQLVSALESTEGHRTDLLGLVPRPLLRMERVIKVDEIVSRGKIYERIPHIGMRRQVHGQVKKIKPPTKGRNVLEQGLAHITIRNVAGHDRGALFSAVTNRINIDRKLGRSFRRAMTPRRPSRAPGRLQRVPR